MSPGFEEVNFNKKKKGAKKPNPFPVKTLEDVEKLLETVKLTKRMIISKLAEMYDPCGFFEIYKIQWKLESRHLSAYGWDEYLPEEVSDHWTERIKEMVELPQISWPRCVVPTDAKNPNKVRLIGVADAAADAAGCIVYASYEREDGSFSSELLTARSKLISYTIPRNELEGVRMLAQTMTILRRILGDIKLEEHFFTDSIVVMCWCVNLLQK